MDLTRNFFVLCTNMKVICIIIHIGGGGRRMTFMKEKFRAAFFGGKSIVVNSLFVAAPIVCWGSVFYHGFVISYLNYF